VEKVGDVMLVLGLDRSVETIASVAIAPHAGAVPARRQHKTGRMCRRLSARPVRRIAIWKRRAAQSSVFGIASDDNQDDEPTMSQIAQAGGDSRLYVASPGPRRVGHDGREHGQSESRLDGRGERGEKNQGDRETPPQIFEIVA